MSDLLNEPQYLARTPYEGNDDGERPYDREPVSVYSVALANSIIVKSGEGKLFGASIYSNNAAAQFILLFDSSTLPADGAVPVAAFTVGLKSNLGLYWGSVGRWFSRGCVLCNSSTAATKSIGSADTFFDVQYI